MPLYEYQCEDGHISCRLRKHTESAEDSTCKECGKFAKRILSWESSFEGAGAGFYNNLRQSYTHNRKKKVWEDAFPESKDTT